MTLASAVDPQAFVAAQVRKISAIATLPEITVQIIHTVDDPRSTASQLHKIVSHDPALVTRILKVVNSSFYGLPGQIASIERAIVLLGLNAIKNIAVAASLGKLFRGVRLCDNFTAHDLWKHCVAVGVVAREITRQLRLPIVDEAFLAGIIHDVGILVALQTMPEKTQQVCEKARSATEPFTQIENSILTVDHQMLGAALAAQWKFPRSCQLVAGYHHQPTSLADENRLLVTIVYAADTLCCRANHGFNLTALHQQMQDGDLHELALDQALIDRVGADLPQLLASSANMF